MSEAHAIRLTMGGGRARNKTNQNKTAVAQLVAMFGKKRDDILNEMHYVHAS